MKSIKSLPEAIHGFAVNPRCLVAEFGLLDNPTIVDPVLEKILIGVACGLVGILIGHLLTKSRESENRARTLIAFLEGWKQEIRAYPWQAMNFDNEFTASLPKFLAACSAAGFCREHKLVAKITSFSGEWRHVSQERTEQRRKEILNAIDQLSRKGVGSDY